MNNQESVPESAGAPGQDSPLPDLENLAIDETGPEYDPQPGAIGPEPSGEYDPEVKSMVCLAVDMVGGVLHQARGAHWALDPKAVERFGEVFALWFQKTYGRSEFSPGWQLFLAGSGLLAGPLMAEAALFVERGKMAPDNQAPEAEAETDGGESGHQAPK